MKKYQYRAIHIAVNAVWGKPIECELCKGKNTSKRYEWSNKNHRYTLEKQDWWQLCAKCHRQYDRKKFGYISWNKGIQGRQSWHNTAGLRKIPWNKNKNTGIVPKTAFRNGNIPWNKDKKMSGEYIAKCKEKKLKRNIQGQICGQICAKKGG